MIADPAFDRRLELARAGDPQAWAEIYDSLAPKLLGYLRAKGAAEPEDVLGEVFVQAVRDLGSFDGSERELRAWVFSIAHHRLIDAARRGARRPATSMPPEEIALLSGSGNVEDEAMARIDAGEVTRMLALLSDDQRTVLLLRIIGGFTVDEVARTIGKRAGAVKQLQRRGLAAMRKAKER
ncbi:MAG: RNA polymerase sigma factor [Solirubrobacterales bacterium]